jgi:Mg-chelatase subunit ChlD
MTNTAALPEYEEFGFASDLGLEVIFVIDCSGSMKGANIVVHYLLVHE